MRVGTAPEVPGRGLGGDLGLRSSSDADVWADLASTDDDDDVRCSIGAAEVRPAEGGGDRETWRRGPGPLPEEGGWGAPPPLPLPGA